MAIRNRDNPAWDAADQWEREREAQGEQERQAVEAQEGYRTTHRTVTSQFTRVRVVYHHDLTLECGHVEHRVRRRAGTMFRRLKCFSCTPTPPPVEEDPRPLGWLGRLITGRKP